MIDIQCNNKTFNHKTILSSFELSLPSKGLFILRGKNGTGKTTLLSMLSGRDRSFEGALKLNGEQLSGNNLERYAEEYVSYCPQDQLIFDNEKTIDNVLIPFAKKDKKSAMAIMKSLGIDDLANNKAGDLSSGEKQRVAIARSIYSSCPILLFDEPTAYLDEESAELVLSAIEECAKSRLVVMSTNEKLPERFEGYPQIRIENKKAVCDNPPIAEQEIRNKAKAKLNGFWAELLKMFRERPISNSINILVSSFFIALSVFFGSALHTGSGSVFSLADSSSRSEDYGTISFLANADLLPADKTFPENLKIASYQLDEESDSKIELPGVLQCVTVDSFGENKLSFGDYQFLIGGFPDEEGKLAIPSYCYESICDSYGISRYDADSLRQINDIGKAETSVGDYSICGVFMAERDPNIEIYLNGAYITDNRMFYSFFFFSSSSIAYSAQASHTTYSFCLNNEENRQLIKEGGSLGHGSDFLLLNKEFEEAHTLPDSLPWFSLLLFAISLFFGVTFPIVMAGVYSLSSAKRMLFLRLGGASRSRLERRAFSFFLLTALVSAILGIGLGIGFVYMYQWLFLKSLFAFPTPFMKIGFYAILLAVAGILLSLLAIYLLLRYYLFRRDLSKALIKAKEK